ncbi:MAG: HAD hydrolase-like protein [Candidatus Pacearchaeota archaeon]|nr:HAD hydrolase-like protein [Candidatus Pacearchaeota archaeon]
MKIAVDLDDTLADSVTSFIDFYNQKYKPTLKYEDFTAYTLNEINGMPKEEENKILEEFDNSEYYDKIKPLKEAIEAIKELSKKHEIIVVTSRPEKFEKRTRIWINKYLPEIKNILFVRKVYHEIPKTKAEVCREINAEVLIDDNLTHAHDCEKEGIRSILIDYPWNRDNMPNSKLIHRVKSWAEIIKIINEIEKELNIEKTSS